MARSGRKDRGLLSRIGTSGKQAWYVRLWHDGRERRFGSFPNKTEAREFYEKAKMEQREGRFFPERYHARTQAKPLPFRDYYETAWRPHQKALGAKKPATLAVYHWRLEKHVLPVFGNTALPNITRGAIKHWAGSLLQQGLDYDTAFAVLLTFSSVVSDAVEDGLLSVNPLQRAGKILPRPKTLAEQEMEIFTEQEEAAISHKAKAGSPETYPIALTFLKSGLRAGEVLGLHREDLNPGTRTLAVRRQWSRWLLQTPKSGKPRVVEIPQSLVDALKDWIALQDLEAAQSGRPTPQILFPGGTGGTRHQPSYMSENRLRYRLWFPLLKTANVRRLDLHAARHTYASRLLAKGASLKYIQQQLGHASLTTTANTYLHLSPGGNRSAVDLLDGDPKGPVLEDNRDRNRDNQAVVESKPLVY